METANGRSAAPPKPWERAGSSAANSGPSPFAPPSDTNSTEAAVASSAATSGDQKDENSRRVSITDGNTAGRPMPLRPWEQNRTGYGSAAMTSYGQSGMYGGGLGSTGYGSGMYGGGLGSSTYGSPYNRVGMYGSGGYGGSMYGGSYGGVGGGMYGNRYGGGYGAMGGMGGSYGMGGMGGAYGMGPGDPNFPGGEPPRAPSFWQSLLHGLTGFMHFFGRLSMLVDENTQAFHFFITALLQLCDRAGILYGELARFVLRLLGFRTSAKAKARSKAAAKALEGAGMQPGDNVGSRQNLQAGQNRISTPEPAWDNVWTDNTGPSS